MTKVVRILTIVTLAFSLAACGKSKEKKAQDSAKSDVQEQNRLAHEINGMGMPSASWSDAKLTDLENKLNTLERLEAQLNSADGKNGVRIYGGNNAESISLTRRQIAQARSEKARQASPTSQPSESRGVGTSPSAGDLKKRLEANLDDILRLQRESDKFKDISEDSSKAEIEQYLKFLDESEQVWLVNKGLYNEALATSSTTYSARSLAKMGIENADKGLDQTRAAREKFRRILAKRDQAA